mgnify:CR=1 FL=1
MPSPDGILAGTRVVDLSTGIAGPVAALLLLEAGADVVKIEPPNGDPQRGEAGFAVWNRGKRSVAVDLDSAAGSKQLQEILADADVLIHDRTPSQAALIGIDDERLAQAFPGLIVSGVTGWPRGHRLCEEPGRETLVLARLGLLDEQPGHRTGPVFIRMPFANWLASWFCAIGVMARLIARQRDGAGGVAHTSLAQAALAPMTMHWARAERPSPSFSKGLDKDLAVAIHQCADGRWIHVHYSPDGAPWMKAELKRLGSDKLAAANARWGKNHTAPNFGANKEIFATRPAQEWLEHLWAHDVAAQPAADFGRIYFDQQARCNGYVVEVDDPVLGVTLQPGSAVHTEPQCRVIGPLRPLNSDAGRIFDERREPADVAPRAPASPPLNGVRVLDLGAYLAGPFATMMLADLGADVIKVEPVGGDAMRYIERAFCGTQRGKRGLALQLNSPQARPILEKLTCWADIVHHNVRMPAARKLGIDPVSLRKTNAKVITCHVSSYGPLGPRAGWPGYDQMFQASCGWEVENGGGAGNPPMWLRFGVTDYLAALSSVFATLLALYHRFRVGEGQHVSSSLLGATLLTVSEAIAYADGRITPIKSLDAGQTGVGSHHRIYACADGWIAVAALKREEREAFDTLVGGDPVSWCSFKNCKRALEQLASLGVPSAPVRTGQLESFLGDPENRNVGLVAEYQHAELGKLTQIGAFWRFDTPLSLRRPPPALSEHSREVLKENGIETNEIERLVACGELKALT